MGKVMQPIVITRLHKHEIEQAIRDLQKRGYELVALKEVVRDGKEFKSDSFKRKIFVGNVLSSKWMAKLRRAVE